MTQEDKELLLKDLCGRLPYGVKVQSTFYNCDGTIWKYENEILTVGLLEYPITRYKPYLYPLSSITKKQIDFINTNPYGIYIQLFDNTLISASIDGFNWLNTHHFDYRGLIPMGLAIDATDKNIY
jgi:hypothetical protein